MAEHTSKVILKRMVVVYSWFYFLREVNIANYASPLKFSSSIIIKHCNMEVGLDSSPFF